VFAGELLIRGAFYFLVASIAKYASNDVPRLIDEVGNFFSALGPPPPLVQGVVRFVLSMLAFFVFLTGLVLTQKGLRTFVMITDFRTRRATWSEHCASTQTIADQIVQLDKTDRQSDQQPGVSQKSAANSESLNAMSDMPASAPGGLG